MPQAPATSSAEQHPQQQQQQQQLRLVSGSADKTLRLWDAATRRTLKISRKLPSEVMCLAVTRQGRCYGLSAMCCVLPSPGTAVRCTAWDQPHPLLPATTPPTHISPCEWGLSTTLSVLPQAPLFDPLQGRRGSGGGLPGRRGGGVADRWRQSGVQAGGAQAGAAHQRLRSCSVPGER